MQFSSSTVPPTALHHGSSVRASVASPFLSTSNRREDVGTRPAHRLYDHQKCMRILGQNASALTLRRLNIITTEELALPVRRGGGSGERTRPEPRTNPRARATLKLTAAGDGRLRQDASGGRRGADPPHGDAGTRSACCTAPALGVPSYSSDEPWHDEGKER